LSDASFPYRVRSRTPNGSSGSITILYRWCSGKAFDELATRSGHQLHLGAADARELARLLLEQAVQIDRTLQQRRERAEREALKTEIAEVAEELPQEGATR
jgi:hypothetical protein